MPTDPVQNRVDFEIRYVEERNRLTTGFRLILAIPHLVFSAVWGYAVELAAVIQWFIVLFTGKRNKGIWDFQNQWLSYTARVNGYANLMYDEYPPFGADSAGVTPTRYAFVGEEPADRLTNGLRIIWAIPAILISVVLLIGALFVTIASWFVIVFTGRHPDGMFRFVHGALRYQLQTHSYALLMTDAYPSYEIAKASPAITPGQPLPANQAPPPPPVA